MYLGDAIYGSSGGSQVGAPPGAKTIFLPPRQQCPPGYHQTRQGRGTSAVIRCTPMGAPIYRPPPAPVLAPVFKPVVTVTPTFQQQFTPQFAPTLQQQQDSPGATQAAEPGQKVSTPQTVIPPPSGENEATKALKEELERIKMQNLIRELTGPVSIAPQIALPEFEQPPIQVPQDTTGLPIPVGMPTYTPGEKPPVQAFVEKKPGVNPWLVGGGILAAALLTV